MLALKRNQPGLHDEVVRYFADPDKGALQTLETTEKDHGRIETRRCSVSHDTGWRDGTRRFPGEHRFRALKTLVEETRYFLSSAPLTPDRAAEAIRSHWGIESLHWVLDVTFKEDQSRLRRGHGAQNMALLRRLAFNILRAGRGKRSLKTARKAAGWTPNFPASLLRPQLC